MKLFCRRSIHSVLFSAIVAAFSVCSSARAATPTLTVTPSTVSNTYSGNITLSISNLNSGETVVVQKFIDANVNGVIDASDLLVQQYQLTDGQAGMVIAGVTNINVPGDSGGTDGIITSKQSFVNAGIQQQMVGSCLYKLSSPAGRFTAITSSFTITNANFAQYFTGTVKSSSTNVPNAGVLLFVPSGGGGLGSPVAGTIANNSGSYTIRAAPGTYLLIAFKNGFVSDVSAPPVIVLNSGVPITTNLTLLPTTRTISGKAVDAANTNLVLPGIMAAWQSTNSLLGVGFTDTNGAFSVGVTSSQWQWSGDSSSLDCHGYIDVNDQGRALALTTTGSVANVSVAFTKGTSLFYGSVKDDQNQPLAGVSLNGNNNDGNSPLSGDATSKQDGDYVMAVNAGTWSANVSSDNNPAVANYIFSQSGDTNVSAGQAVQQNFVGTLATNHISGYLRDNGSNPIGNVWIWANASTNGAYYQTGVDTDGTGHYSFNVANGTWDVGVDSGGSGDSLPGNYLCPASQSVVIFNNNGTANFTAIAGATHQITGHVQQTNGNPIPNLGVEATATINGVMYHVAAGTDGSGNYSLNVVNTNWSVGVFCSGGPGGNLNNLDNILGPGNYQCPDAQNVTISNNNGTANFSVSLILPLQILTTNLPDGTNGVYYSQPLNASGGQPPYNWSLSPSSQSLPPNLNFNFDGSQETIAGTPATNGTFNFSVRVTDNNGNTADQPLSLFIGSSVPDVLDYYVTKLEAFVQLDPTNIVLNSNAGPFTAFLGLVQSSVGVVPIANVELPTGAFRALPRGSSGIELQTGESFADEASFDAAYPAGNYSFAMATAHDGFMFPVLAMPAPQYPIAPRVSNFAAAQSVDPTTDFVLQWDAFSAGTTNDSMWVKITDANGNPVFSTPYPGTNFAGSLKGTATSVTVPNNTLQFGRAYKGAISFFKVTSVNTSEYPGAAGITTAGAMTAFPLTTVSASPVLSQPTKLSGTQFRFQLSGIAGQNYTVQFSTTLTNWNTLLITNAPAHSFLLMDLTATNAQRFYRVKIGP